MGRKSNRRLRGGGPSWQRAMAQSGAKENRAQRRARGERGTKGRQSIEHIPGDDLEVKSLASRIKGHFWAGMGFVKGTPSRKLDELEVREVKEVKMEEVEVEAEGEVVEEVGAIWESGSALAGRSGALVSAGAQSVFKGMIRDGVGIFFKIASVGGVSDEDIEAISDASVRVASAAIAIGSRKVAELTLVQKGSLATGTAGVKVVKIAKPLVAKVEKRILLEAVRFSVDPVSSAMDWGSIPAVMNLALKYSSVIPGLDSDQNTLMAFVVSHYVRVELGLTSRAPLDLIILEHMKGLGGTNAVMRNIKAYQNLPFLVEASIRPVVGVVLKKIQHRMGLESA